MIFEFVFKWKMSLLGLVSGAVAGLVAVTPAAGFAGPMGAAILGAVAGVVCLFFCTAIKWLLRYDDSLDVFGIHCIGGIVGALGTGLLVSPEFGGTGVLDYVVKPGAAEGRRVRARRAADRPGQGRRADAGVVGHRLGHHLQDRGHVYRRPRRARKPSRPASTSPQHGERGYVYEH